jgi:amino acid transporter
MLTKLAAIAADRRRLHLRRSCPDAVGFAGSSGGAVVATAMVPVLFAYGGWQTASFVSGEMRDPRRDLPRGLLIGVVAVIVLYLASRSSVCARSEWTASRRHRRRRQR